MRLHGHFDSDDGDDGGDDDEYTNLYLCFPALSIHILLTSHLLHLPSLSHYTLMMSGRQISSDHLRRWSAQGIMEGQSDDSQQSQQLQPSCTLS